MNQKPRAISAVQLVLLLFVSRLFSLLIFTPRAGETEGSVALAAIPLSAVVVLLAGLPALLLHRRAGCGILEASERAGSGAAFAAHAGFGLFCIAAAGMTAARFSTFMTSAVYPNSTPWFFLLSLVAAGAYAARLGLEPIARLSLPVFLLAVAAGAAMTIGLWQFIRWEQVAGPLYNGWKPLGQGIWRNAASYVETVLFLLLIPRVKGGTDSGRTWCGWLVLSTAAIEFFALITLTALGEYAGTRQFPVHSAAAAARIGSLGRLDLLYLFLWVFAAFLRTAAYLYGGCVCLGGLAHKMGLAARACWAGGAAGLLALAIAGWKPLRYWMSEALGNGLWSGILLVGFPIALLLMPGVKKKNTGGDPKQKADQK